MGIIIFSLFNDQNTYSYKIISQYSLNIDLSQFNILEFSYEENLIMKMINMNDKPIKFLFKSNEKDNNVELFAVASHTIYWIRFLKNLNLFKFILKIVKILQL